MKKRMVPDSLSALGREDMRKVVQDEMRKAADPHQELIGRDMEDEQYLNALETDLYRDSDDPRHDDGGLEGELSPEEQELVGRMGAGVFEAWLPEKK